MFLQQLLCSCCWPTQVLGHSLRRTEVPSSLQSTRSCVLLEPCDEPCPRVYRAAVSPSSSQHSTTA